VLMWMPTAVPTEVPTNCAGCSYRWSAEQ
jgi:hypothetical protein